MTKSIEQKLFFNHKPEAVWEYLTNAELMAQWLMPNDFQPVLWHDFQFTTKAYPDLDFDGHVYCKVLEIVPYKKLVYSWKSGPGEGRISVDSIVTWTLVEKDNGTELQLVHSGFKEIANLKLYAAMTDGWMKNIQKIAVLLNDATHGAANV
ncbi:SRPBCC family protein [Deminuibacter soli]|uniref:SRPBCC domain-containing protein n=1 Tax=Deminuibacter soli TaxID=2291815 RepID=A0A3E1NF36_9BACT|nr:SRPBCC domain-containing protein [Deminuibacter soli]RFM26421.1 SRPBCC domain-containing protein [Deminuibacter soli]